MKPPRLLLVLALAGPSTALAWPASDDAWIPARQGGVEQTDVVGDHGGGDGATDLVGEAGAPAASWFADDTHLYVRMRLDDEPWFIEDVLFVDGGWGVLVDQDRDGLDYEWLLGVEGANDPTLTAWENSTSTGGIEDEAETLRAAWTSPLDDEQLRVVEIASPVLGGEPDVYLDLAFERAILEDELGLTDLFSLCFATGTSDVTLLDADVVGVDESATSPTLAACLGDAIAFDQDGDGLSDAEEENLGTSATDADTDDDGLDDQTETELGTSGVDCDTDDDGLSDGLEAGVSEAGEGTDTTSGCWTPDADAGATTTDPLDPDSDHDDDSGLSDGAEDRDGDGVVDDWETDPNDPTDDLDTDGDGIADALEDECGGADTTDGDGDGIPDAEEGLGDTDGDGLPDFCDDDDDDDGLPTAEEGTNDTDGDGDADPYDPDADDDGVEDGLEGTEDGDCDGIPDWQDDAEGDGPCADADEDGVVDDDEEECGSNPGSADTDGDGIGDADESCDDDADCDGLPDRLDDETDPDGCDEVDDTAGGPGDCIPGDPFLDCGKYTGGACSVLPFDAAILPALLAMAATLRRRGAALAALGVLSPGLVPLARAQDELDSQRFRPTPDGRAFLGLDDASLLLDGPGGGATFNYANDPLVYRMDDGTEVPLVGSLGTLDVYAFWTARPIRVALDVPLHIAGDTDLIEPGFRLGDARVDAKIRLYDRPKSPVRLAVGLDAKLPTGDEQAWLGGAGPEFGGRVIASGGHRLAFTANLGGRFGKSVELLPDLAWGPRLTWGLGASAHVTDAVRLLAEADGELALGTLDAAGALPMEGRLGARLFPTRDLAVTLAGGAGLSQGVGAPDYRLIAGVAYVPAPERTKAVAAGGADRDGDGIADTIDRCPDQPEDKNGRNDTDGCPDAGLTPVRLEVKDPRGARVAGAILELVSGPEAGKYVLGSGEMTRSLRPGVYQVRVEADGYVAEAAEMKVPDADHHERSFTIKPALVGGEVVVSARNTRGEPLSALVTVIGSPGRKFTTGPDGVGEERLPLGGAELSVWSEGYQPKRVKVDIAKDKAARVEVVLEESRVTVTAERVEIRDKVFFEFDSAVIKPQSFVILDDVAATLENHPEIALVEVGGHTDDQGTDAYNLELSQRRADAVRDYLVKAGIEGTRLVAKGYGESQPLQPGTTEDAREVNRRVVFAILRAAPRDDAPPAPGRERPRRK